MHSCQVLETTGVHRTSRFRSKERAQNMLKSKVFSGGRMKKAKEITTELTLLTCIAEIILLTRLTSLLTCCNAVRV